MTTIQITHMAPIVVGTTEINLPFFFTSGNYSKSYCCITEDFRLIDVHHNSMYTNIDVKRYDDMEDIATRLEIEMREKLYEPIEEAVFMHHFSLAHREVFYSANPNALKAE
jgi:hypothetical protein